MKKCEKYQRWMWLKLYDELDEEQQNELSKHLHACTDCVHDFEEINETKKLLDKKIQQKPTVFFLEQNRAELHQRLLLATQPRYRSNWKNKIWGILSLDFSPALRFSTAVAMLLIGFIIGRQLIITEIHEQDFYKQQFSSLSNTNITSVESINYDPEIGQVFMKLNTIKQLTVQGDMENPQIKQLLAQTLISEEKSNIRLKSVGALSLSKIFDKQVVKALIEVLEKDENPGVRLKAIRLLNKIPINASLKKLITVGLIHVLLKEENSAIRNEAIDGLKRLKNGSAEAIIYNVVKNDSSEYIRSKATLILQRIKNPEVPEQ